MRHLECPTSEDFPESDVPPLEPVRVPDHSFQIAPLYPCEDPRLRTHKWDH